MLTGGCNYCTTLQGIVFIKKGNLTLPFGKSAAPLRQRLKALWRLICPILSVWEKREGMIDSLTTPDSTQEAYGHGNILQHIEPRVNYDRNLNI